LRARSRPARVRCRIISRSNSAKLPAICIIMRPVGMVVSIASVRERKPAPADALFSIMRKKVHERPRKTVKLPDDNHVTKTQVIKKAV
jgi:hypothetical protein